MKPGTLARRPPLIVASLGGAVGVLLLAALIHLAPVAGGALVDLPRLIGGVFSANATAAFWLGFAILYVLGWLVWPALIVAGWNLLPGDPVRLRGALLKGVLGGAALWALTGVLLPVLAWASRFEFAPPAGLFGLGGGIESAAALFVAHVGYGVAVAVIAVLGRGISPLESLGMSGYSVVGGLVEQPHTGEPAE